MKYLFAFSFSVFFQIINAQNTVYTALYTSGTFIKTTNVLLPVGAIDAAADVAAGGASYTIPIVIPPGTNGIAPSVAVVYNSMAGSGVAGRGWSISGLSAITRIGQTIYHNGFTQPVDLGADDKFGLDGMRLLTKSGAYGGNGSTYGTELENFATITSLGNIGGGPERFSVTTKEGVVMEYGNTADARFLNGDNTKVLLWRLNKILYTDGNYIEFKYNSNTDRASQIDEIKYTGNAAAGILPYNKIKFSYTVRSDVNTVYEAGASMVNKYLLDKITVTADAGAAFKIYTFKYATHNNINSFLKEVIETGTNGTNLNSTIFKYGDMPAAFQPVSSSTILGDLVPGDVNGDGYSDLIALTRNPVDDIVYHSEFKIWQKEPIPSNDNFVQTATVTLPPNYIAFQPFSGANNSYTATDFNGDGATDLIFTKTTGTGTSRKFEELRVYNSPATGYNYASPYTLVAPAYNHKNIHSSGKYMKVGDFNGDGKSDVLVMLSTTESPDYYYINVCYGAGAGNWVGASIIGSGGFFPESIWPTVDRIDVLDFDGDGKDEVMLIKDGTCEIFTFYEYGGLKPIYLSGFPTKWHLLFFGDFNGDNKTDILSRTSTTDDNAPWYKSVSTGKGFVETPFTFNHTPDINEAYFGDKILISDYNSDGKMDISHSWNHWVGQGANNATINKYYSNGDGFYSEQYSYTKTFFTDPNLVFTFDANGDSRSDMLNRALAIQPFELLYYNKEGKDLLLHKVKDGVDHTTEWTYKRMTEAGTFYTRGNLTSHPLNNVQFPISLAYELKSQDGIGGNTIVQYAYEEAKLHKDGKGFLGIKKIKASNLATGMKTVAEAEFNTTYYTAAPYKTSVYLISNNSLLSETTLTNQFAEQGVNSKRIWIKVNSSYNNKVFENQYVSSSNTYDIYGNATQNITDNNGDETTTTTATYGAYGSPVPAKPTTVTVSKTRCCGPPAYNVTTTYTYNTLGQLTGKTNFSGLPQSVATSFTYNNLGNQTGNTITPSGMPVRSSSTTFDSKGRFGLSTTNALGQTASATYDAKWGKPLTETGMDGLAMTYSYDAFGRLQSTIMPQGWTLTETYGWEINATEGTIHYHQSTHPGKPDVKIWYDVLDREKKKQVEGFQGQWITSKQTYDSRGNVSTSIAPYKTGEPLLTTTNTYDDYNRLISASNTLGTTSYSYVIDISGYITVTATNPAGQVSSKVMDTTGKTVSATDYGGTLTYSYNSQGNLLRVDKGITVLTLSEFDAYARQTKLTDINAGVTQYAYDALGQMTSQISALGQVTTVTYDLLGRVTQRVGTEGTVTNEYFPSASGASTNKIKKTTGFTGDIQEYTYDNFGRVSTDKVTVDGVAHTHTYTYTIYNDVASMVYPSGFTLNYSYDANGYLNTLKNGNNSVTLFTNTGMNGLGQYTSYTLGNGKTSTNTYSFGSPTRYFTSGIQDLNMAWNQQNGNFTSRNDAIKSKTESFTYDNLNRLLSSSGAGLSTITTAFATSGNINSKTDAGNYTYGGPKINAVTAVTNPNLNISGTTQDITYTPYFQPATISEGTNSLTYTYGADYQRIKGVLTQNGNVTDTRYYFGGYEKDIIGSATKHIHYINSGQGLVAMVVRENSTDTYNYIYTDHLGSILTVTNNSGVVTNEQNFDAWGRKRNPTNWTYANIPAVPSWLYRGYTGHEHLPQFNLINMNGRVYDPLIARMLSTDNHVQEPGHTQSFNRYTYAFNNPMSYTDPNGEIAFAAAVFIVMVAAMVNVSIEAAKGNVVNGDRDFYKAFGIGVLKGIAVVVAAPTTAAAFSNVAGAAVSPFLPSISIPVGDNITISLSPALVFSSGIGIGANVGVTAQGNFGSIGLSYGLTAFSGGGHYATGKSFLEQRFGYGVTFGGKNGYLTLGSTIFSGGGFSQRSGFTQFGGKDWSFTYENDMILPRNWGGRVIADNGDRFRTGGIRLQVREFSAGLNVFTGDPGLRSRDHYYNGNGDTRGTYYELNNTDDYRFAGAYLGYGNYRIGVNSENIRAKIQNGIHNKTKDPWFYKCNNNWAPYSGYFTKNPFTSW